MPFIRSTRPKHYRALWQTWWFSCQTVRCQMLSLMGKQKVSANCQIRSHRLETEKYAPCAVSDAVRGKHGNIISVKLRLYETFNSRTTYCYNSISNTGDGSWIVPTFCSKYFLSFTAYLYFPLSCLLSNPVFGEFNIFLTKTPTQVTGGV